VELGAAEEGGGAVPVPAAAVEFKVLERERRLRRSSSLLKSKDLVVSEALRLGVDVRLGGTVTLAFDEGGIMPPVPSIMVTAVPPEVEKFAAPGVVNSTTDTVDDTFKLGEGVTLAASVDEFDGDGIALEAPPMEVTAVSPGTVKFEEPDVTEADGVSTGVETFELDNGVFETTPFAPVTDVTAVPPDTVLF
jgi:hypothetical protein